MKPPETVPEIVEDAPKPPSGHRRFWRHASTPLGWLMEGVVVLVLVAAVLALAARIGPMTGEARRLIEAEVNAQKLPFGRVHIEGLRGDLWRDFKLRRLTVADAKGVWLEADDVEVQWRYAELLRRRLHIQALTIQTLHLLRQPAIPPSKTPPAKPPAFSYALDALKARADIAPAVFGASGLYDVSGSADVQNNGGTVARVDVESVLRPGDHLRAQANLGRTSTLLVDADALEVKGGAIAGALGLPADRPFSLMAHVTGTTRNGKLTLLARSGDQTPVDAQGAWSPDGGGASAHIVMGASRWTQGLVPMFGPQAEVAVIGKKHPGDETIYDLDLRFIADNLVLMARGPADLAKRTSGGLALSVLVKNLKALTPAPAMDQGRATGTLSGDLGDLRFAGSAEAANLELLGWRLTRASGAVKVGWKKGELTIDGDVNGQGGSGQGVIADAGGAKPHIVTQVVRYRDGRLLIKSLHAVGNGVDIQATGGQNILNGGLQFKGDLQVADLAKIAPGAAGALQGGWSATQDNGPDQPWLFTFEGRGDHYATGTPEMDRLLGPEPRLSGSASLLGQVVTVTRASVEGAKERASAQGAWDFAGPIRFALDWEAEGPFGFGPLAIDGKAKGGGTLSGTFAQPRAELTAGFESIAFPEITLKTAKLDLTFAAAKDGSDGTLALTGASDYGPARARSAFRFFAGGIALSGIDADVGGVKAKGALALRDGAPSSADLTLAIGPGAVLSEGQATGTVKIVDAAGGASAKLDLQAKGAVTRGPPLALATGRLTAAGPLDKLPYRLTADGAWLRTPVKMDGSGVFSRDPTGYSLTFTGSGDLRRAPFKTLEPAQLRLDENDRFARLRLSLGGGDAELDGRDANGALNLTAHLSGVDLSFLSEDFTGQFDADMVLAGRGHTLAGTLDADLKNARSRDARKGLSIDGAIKTILQDDKITLTANLKSPQGLTSSASVVLPAEAQAFPFRIGLARTKPMVGSFQADGEIQPLWDLFLGGERTLGGRLAAQATLAGTLADPKITGRADLKGGLFDDYATGLKLRNLNIGAALNTDVIAIDSVQGSDAAKGQVSGSGQVSLARGGGGTLQLNLNGFRLIDNDTAQADVTGKVAVTRDAEGKAKITGALDLVKAEINAAARTGPSIVSMDVIEKNRPFRLDEQLAPTPAAGGGQPAGVDIDVALKAKKGVLVKGRGLDMDMSLDARVTGSTSKPLLDGDARVVHGDYDFGGKRFEFDDRGVVHLSNDPNLIRLDLTATREDPSLTAVIRILGTAAKPKITLSSTPVLPNDEVLSQVLFGASASQLSPLEAAQLASALTALAGGGGFDVIGGLRNFARLDRLALVGGGTTGVSVAGGKYLSDNAYIELAGGGRSGPSVQVEYRVTKALSLVSSLANQTPATQGGGVYQGGAKLSVRWRHDFKDKKTPASPAGQATAR